MIAPMLIRSITLSEETANAWRITDGWYPRRERNQDEMLDLAARHPDTPIINLGNTTFSPDEHELIRKGLNPKLCFNRGDDIRPLVRPGTARVLLNELMPAYPVANGTPQLIWVKAPGSKGRGKNQKTIEDRVPEIPKDWDLQVHVEGDEYRVITIDDKVVQVLARDTAPDGSRLYEWVGVTNCPKTVKTKARAAARLLKGRNIIGWDIVVNTHNDVAYILEGNSCPGVSVPTVERIWNYINGRSYEDA